MLPLTLISIVALNAPFTGLEGDAFDVAGEVQNLGVNASNLENGQCVGCCWGSHRGVMRMLVPSQMAGR